MANRQTSAPQVYQDTIAIVVMFHCPKHGWETQPFCYRAGDPRFSNFFYTVTGPVCHVERMEANVEKNVFKLAGSIET